MTHPRTRKQLREALEFEKKERADDRTFYKGVVRANEHLEAEVERFKARLKEMCGIFTKDKEKVRENAFQLVIDALQLREYGYRGEGEFYFDLYKESGVERLEKDLQIALNVREQRRLQAEHDATEKKVVGLLKSKLAQGGYVTLGAQVGIDLSGCVIPAVTVDELKKTAEVGEALPKKKKGGKK